MNEIALTTDDRRPTTDKQPLIFRGLAHILSYIFHPLFIPLYAAYFLLYIHPSYFSGFSNRSFFVALSRHNVLFQVIENTILFPFMIVLLLKGLGFIESILFKKQQDRVLLYITSMICFFWGYYSLREQPDIPRILVAFIFGVFISTSAALIANIYYKVSMHAIGMGGMIGLFLVVMQQHSMLMTGPLFFALLIAGAVCTARMIVSDHTPKEIYAGLIIGLVCQFAGALINLA
jgi:hypothetical protein